MDKILEALSKLALPENDMKEISTAVSSMMEDARKELEASYDANLEEAYASLSEELQSAEKVGEQGYREAWDIISELRNRMEMMRVEYDSALEEGYEQAYQKILSEKGKNESLEVEIHNEYEKRYVESKEFIVDKVDAFLKSKGKEIYEMARRDIMNDPSMVEHKVVLEKIVESVSDYISDEDRIFATSSKLDATKKALDETNGRIRMLEAKNIRLSTENNKLNETVKQAAEMINESKQVAVNENKKARVEKAKNATGRGKVTTDKTEVIAEYAAERTTGNDENSDNTLVESFTKTKGLLQDWKQLAGLNEVNNSLDD